MRILMTGGGTAGHVNPALAIAAAIRERHPDAEFLFVASDAPTDKAADLVPRAGYTLRTVHIRGLQPPILQPANFAVPFSMLRARRQAARLIREFRPDLIVGTGGFACWAPCDRGAALGIPTVLHESNAFPGKAIRMLRDKADRILVNFDETADRLKEEGTKAPLERVGNPFMPGFSTVSRAEARKQLGLADDERFVLSFGGSGGAEALNTAMLGIAERVLLPDPHVKLLLGCGKADHARMQKAWDASPLRDCPRMELSPYIYDMPVQMAAADLVIARAGAMTISEVALMGKPTILVPYPYAAAQHQLKNAQALAGRGAGVCVEEKDVPSGALEREVTRLLTDDPAREALGRNIRTYFAAPDANERICRALDAVMNAKA